MQPYSKYSTYGVGAKVTFQTGLTINRLQRKPQQTIELHHTENNLQRMAPGEVVCRGEHDEKAQWTVDQSRDNFHGVGATLQHAVVIAVAEICNEFTRND